MQGPVSNSAFDLHNAQLHYSLAQPLNSQCVVLQGNVAPSFIGLEPQDPLAQVFGQSPFPLSSQGGVSIQLNSLSLGFGSQLFLAVAANYSHVPSYLVNLIVVSLCVDFTLLLPTNLSKLPTCMPDNVQLGHFLGSDLAKILNLRDWSDAWAVYTAVLSKNFPEKVLDLLAYYLLISKADREVPGCNWMSL